MKHLKKTFFYLLCAGLFAFVLVLAGCDLFPTSISARITAFESDLNGTGERGIVDNFHPNMTSRSLWSADASFNSTPLAQVSGRTFSIAMSGSPADIGGGYMSQSGTVYFSTGAPASRPIYFEFLEDGVNNWKIYYMLFSATLFEWGTP